MGGLAVGIDAVQCDLQTMHAIFSWLSWAPWLWSRAS